MYADVGADGLDNPRPLCVVKSAEPVTATDIMQVVQDDELVVDDSCIEPNSKFGISPFTINLTHKDAPLDCQFKLERTLKWRTHEDKMRYT